MQYLQAYDVIKGLKARTWGQYTFESKPDYDAPGFGTQYRVNIFDRGGERVASTLDCLEAREWRPKKKARRTK